MTGGCHVFQLYDMKHQEVCERAPTDADYVTTVVDSAAMSGGNTEIAQPHSDAFR